MKVVQNYNKYENYIRIGHTATSNGDDTYTCTDLQDFPTPAKLSRKLHDVDKDAFTDLEGYTHRNRVRHDVEEFEVTFPVLSDADEQFILNLISPEWVYVELIDKKTRQRKTIKMYASDKQWDTFMVFKDNNNNWCTEDVDLTFSMVQE